MSSMDLVEFLTARLDEDEEEARTATAGPWSAVEVDYLGYGLWWEIWDSGSDDDRQYVALAGGEGGGVKRPEDAAHIARWQPARVLSDVAAKRRLIERYVRAVAATPSGSSYVRGQDDGYRQACLDAIRDAVEIHADHPDYREEWRP